MKTRGARADEFIRVLKAIWTTDPVEFRGEFFQIPRSIIQPKPDQQPHPPIYLAAYSPAAMKRVATMADGWNPAGVPVEGMAQMMEEIRRMASQAGRGASDIKLVVRANLVLTDQALGDDRYIFAGSLDQVKSDIQATENLGADEIFFDPTFSSAGASAEGFLKNMEKIKSIA